MNLVSLSNEDFDKFVCQRFPLLFRDRFAPMNVTCMCWGLDVGQGWNQIIFDLCSELEPLVAKLPEPARSSVCFSQIKEKYGTLRAYMTRSTDEMAWLISEAEARSARTCENCGMPGKLRYGGWVSAQCDRCFLTSLAGNVMEQCRYKAFPSKKLNYKNEEEDCIEYKDKDELQDLLVETLARKFRINLNPEPEKNPEALKTRLIYWCRWTLLYNLKRPFNKYFWKYLPGNISRKFRYKLWKFKRSFK